MTCVAFALSTASLELAAGVVRSDRALEGLKAKTRIDVTCGWRPTQNVQHARRLARSLHSIDDKLRFHLKKTHKEPSGHRKFELLGYLSSCTI
jgi:hypothetical protein